MRSCVGEVHVEPGPRRLTASAGGLVDVSRVGEAFAATDIAVDDLGLKRPSLDDVFLRLTGHRAEGDHQPGTASELHPEGVAQ